MVGLGALPSQSPHTHSFSLSHQQPHLPPPPPPPSSSITTTITTRPPPPPPPHQSRHKPVDSASQRVVVGRWTQEGPRVPCLWRSAGNANRTTWCYLQQRAPRRSDRRLPCPALHPTPSYPVYSTTPSIEKFNPSVLLSVFASRRLPLDDLFCSLPFQPTAMVAS